MSAGARPPRRVLWLAALLCVAIFSADLLLPASVATGVVYVVPLLLSLWRGDHRMTRRLAGICAALILLAVLLQAVRGALGDDLWLVLANRALALFAVAAAASLARMRLTQEREILHGRERFETTLSSIADAVVTTGPDGRVTFMNAVAERLTGWTAGAALGRSLNDVCRFTEVEPPPSARGGPPAAGTAPSPSSAAPGLRRARLRSRDGRALLIEGTRALLPTSSLSTEPAAGAAAEREANLVLVFRDASERESYERSMERLAFRDTLTGLPNRSSLDDRLGLELAHARRNGESLALMFLDLDGFKEINDTLGHQAGDALLVGVAERLTRCLREGDTVARLGGDEFTILLPRVAGPRAAALVAKKIVDSLRLDKVPFHGRELSASPSIGIALFPAHAGQESELLRLADEAMYAAKQAGGGCWRFHREDREARVADKDAQSNPRLQRG